MVIVNSKLNHPEYVLKYIPLAVNNRLQNISSSQNIFKETAQHYQKAIKASVYDHQLAYSHKDENGKNKKRRRKNILYFNAPFCKSVATRFLKLFLEIMNKNFI